MSNEANWKLFASICAAGAILALTPAAASAATITPNILTDEDTANANCSLREAVTAANTDGDHNGCVAAGAMVNEDADTIVLQSGQTYSLSLIGIDETNAAGDLDVLNEALTIQASGAGKATIDANGGTTLDRVLDLDPANLFAGDSVTITNLVITDGADGDGGGGAGIRYGVFVPSLTISGSTITGNNSPGGAGTALRLDGSATTITNTSISSNTGGFAAIFHEIGTLTITGSTISGHAGTGASNSGGAIQKAVASGTTTLINSTVSGNSTPANGGGIAVLGGTLNLRNSTITNNTADSDAGGTAGNGGGLFIGGGTANVRNSIIADNIDLGATTHPDCSGTIVSELHNLIGSATGCTGVDPAGDDLQGFAGVTAPLADNGGPTPTRALLAGSAALNPTFTGNTGPGQPCEATDQRGLPRGGPAAACDIGAFEAQPPVLSPIGNRSVQAGQNLTFTVSATDPDPADTLSFSASNLPAGATFDPMTRTFSWTPSASQVGSFPGVGFAVNDGTYNDNETITITVTAVPSPPPTGGGTTPTTQPTPQVTGQRAAALKKCKKKRSKRARRNCKKRAKKLPV